MLEILIKEKKAIIDKEAKIKKKQIDFIKEEFNNNLSILQKYIREKNKSVGKVFEEMEQIIKGQNNLHIESTTPVKIEYLLDILPVKIGYYEMFKKEGEKISAESSYIQCTLTFTRKGKSVFQRYNEISDV